MSTASLDTFVSQLNWTKWNNLKIKMNGETVTLLPTIVKDVHGLVLGLCYSSKESLCKALATGTGIYFSRQRGLWIKSPSGANGQRLISVQTDCDGDALLFIVEQRGNFCHIPGKYSCFSPENGIVLAKDHIQIGYCLGRQESIALDLLRSLGIHVFHSKHSRNPEISVKSHLHHDIGIVESKPKDIFELFKHGMMDICICYDNLMKPTSWDKRLLSNGIICWEKENGVKPVTVALIRKKSSGVDDFAKPVTIFSEYPEMTDLWIRTSGKFPYLNYKLVSTSGNTEALLKTDNDFGVVVVDSGKTIRDFGLEVVQPIMKTDMKIYFRESVYRKYPRFFRNLKNSLETDTIYFYSVDTPEGFLSNFYMASFVDDVGRTWKSSEHYYQAHKFKDQKLFDLIQSQPTPKSCYKTAWKYEKDFRDDWIEVKDKFMWEALQFKFAIPALKKKLIDTYPKKLVEHALKDSWYGCGVDGSGKNILGKMLMLLRDDAMKQSKL